MPIFSTETMEITTKYYTTFPILQPISLLFIFITAINAKANNLLLFRNIFPILLITLEVYIKEKLAFIYFIHRELHLRQFERPISSG